MAFQEIIVSMIISTSESITPFHMFTQLLTSERGHDLNVHTFVANSMILVGDLGQLEPILIGCLSARTFVQWLGSSILSVHHRILVSQSCLFLPKRVLLRW